MEKRYGFGELTPVGVPRQELVVVLGRIYCESAEGKINKASILLEVRHKLERVHSPQMICWCITD